MSSASSKEVLNAFLSRIAKSAAGGRVAHLCISRFSLMDSVDGPGVDEVRGVDSLSGTYEVLFADLPFGDMPRRKWKSGSGKELSLEDSRIALFESIEHLDKNGRGYFVVEPHGFFGARTNKVIEELSRQGFFVEGYFRTPEGILSPHTPLRPSIACVSRSSSDCLFVGELATVVDAQTIAENFLTLNDSGSARQGTFVTRDEFRGFDQLRVVDQISNLRTQYKDYDDRTIDELSLEINTVRSGGSFDEQENAVYIPRIGNSAVVSRLSDATLKHQNYFQLVLDPTVANNNYVQTSLIQVLENFIEALRSETFIPRLNKSDLVELRVRSLNS